MKWIFKALAHQTLGRAPGGEFLHYLFQRHVTRTLPLDGDALAMQFSLAEENYRLFWQYRTTSSSDALNFYEFGAGRELAVPLANAALGVRHQTVTDVARIARLDLINRVLAELKPAQPVHSFAELRQRLGLEYRAPNDPRRTGLPAAWFDFICANYTLECIPARDLPAMLQECRRLLKPGGVVRFVLNLKDNYAWFDRTISPYNFLRYHRRDWRWFSPPGHFQNRLRRTDYLRLFREAGFKVAREEAEGPEPAELERLRQIEVAEEFQGYSIEDLGVKSLKVVLV